MIDKELRKGALVYRGIYSPSGTLAPAHVRLDALRLWCDLPAPGRKKNGEITARSMSERFTARPVERDHQHIFLRRADVCATRAEAVEEIISKIDKMAERDRQQARDLLTQKGQ